MDREERIRSLYGTVSRMKKEGYNTGKPLLRQSHEMSNEEEIEEPRKKKRRPTYINPHLRGEDRRWLQDFIKED